MGGPRLRPEDGARKSAANAAALTILLALRAILRKEDRNVPERARVELKFCVDATTAQPFSLVIPVPNMPQ